MKKENKQLKDYQVNKKLNIEKMIAEYSGYIYTVIKNSSNQNISNEDIEEIMADTFFIFWKKQSSLDIETKISSYLVGIAKNLLREKARNVKFSDNILDYENVLVSKENLNDFLEEQQLEEAIERSLQNMSEEDNDIFRLYYYAGKKVKQIAKQLDITEFKVKTKLHRIRKKIKKDLREGGYEYGK